MKTKTYVYNTRYSDDIRDFIDNLYEKYGDRVVNLSVATPKTDYVLFYTIRADDNVNID